LFEYLNKEPEKNFCVLRETLITWNYRFRWCL